MTAIEETIQWIDKFVIRHNLCPFAKEPHKNGLIHYEASTGHLTEELLQEAFDQILQLDSWSPAECSTSFFIINSTPVSFMQLLQYIDLLETLMEDFNLIGRFQLVPFHPEFEFQGAGRDAISNRVNQSPYPMMHILRSSQVEDATSSHKSDTEITRKNDLTLGRIYK